MVTAHHTSDSAFATGVLFVVLAFLLIVYLLAAASQGSTRHPWSGWRTLSFILGIALLAFSASPLLGAVAPHGLPGHMVQHLLIGMFAPLGLVFAAPITLALRTLPVAGARCLTSLLRSWPLRWISHPISALVLNIGGLSLLYLTPLYGMTLTNPSLHRLVEVHFLAAGTLFTWAIAGPDPAPHRPPMRTRLIVLFLSIAAHATLSKLMYAYLWPRNIAESPDSIRAAAQLMYYGGDLAELLLAVALFASWYQGARRRYARRVGAAGRASSL